MKYTDEEIRDAWRAYFLAAYGLCVSVKTAASEADIAIREEMERFEDVKEK